MPIPAIAPVGGVTPTGYLDASQRTPATGGSEFGAALAQAIDQTQALQGESKSLAVKAVTGDLTDIHDATIAATKAALAIEVVSTVRNKGVDAFNEIMRLQA